MANEEHLAILRQGVETWNEWRLEHPEISPDLANSDLCSQNLRSINFRKANLYQANLDKADLTFASLISSDLRQAKLREATLYRSHLTEAKLNGATLWKADLSNSCLADSKLKNSILVETNLSWANLSGCTATAANFSRADFTGSYLKGWNPIDAIFTEVICDFVYLKSREQRFPAERDFTLREFSKIFQVDHSYSNLAVLDQLINQFEKLLDDFPEGNESKFHKFLEDYPILIDIRVSQKNIVPKPRFYYPPGESLLGKKYVEPDFLIRYSGNEYQLVELERPGKQIATKQGQPTSGVNQAAFQIEEWDDYIRNHIDRIRDE